MIKSQPEPLVAYISMEIALEDKIKTYAGGLGVLAGDILRSAANMKFPMAGVTLFNQGGYFKQTIAEDGEQKESPDKSEFLLFKKMPQTVKVNIGKETVLVGAWRYLIKDESGFCAPVYFLDTDLSGNTPENRRLSGALYGGNEEYRLKQEIILGRGAVKMLAAVGHKQIIKFHLNEGHGALAAVELFLNSNQAQEKNKIKEVRKKCVFTSHTPVAKAQDIFSLPYFLNFQPDFPGYLPKLVMNNEINMTRIGLYFSGFANAVSKAHQKTSGRLYQGFALQAVVNGVDSLFWTAPEFKILYDQHIPGWRAENSLLKKAEYIPPREIWSAHQQAKKRLLSYIAEQSGSEFNENVFTVAFARRFAVYKRPEFLFRNLGRLLEINKQKPLQLIYAGKAHPDDLEGKELVKKINLLAKGLGSDLRMVFLENYDLEKVRLLTAGVDLWLNNPLPPNEASGTSGMKAAHNGIPQASTFDGWWVEGYKKNKTGWKITEKTGDEIYDLLEKDILPLYYDFPEKWRGLMISTISRNAAYFNAQRALREYIKNIYRLHLRKFVF